MRRQSKEAEDYDWEDRKVSNKNKRDPDWDDGDDEEMEDEEEYYAKLDQQLSNVYNVSRAAAEKQK